MYEDDLNRIYSLINHNLHKDIAIGLHSHNNLQLSFMLVQKIINLGMNKRDIIVDSSCLGIGRGAGNANTELVVDYLVRKINKNYDINEILDILDTYILKIKKNHEWGYSTPYFISGMYSVHVNNINYLLNKHNIKAKDMNFIISGINRNSEKRYDYEKLEANLVNYFSVNINDNPTIEELRNKFKNKEILLIAPGTSVSIQRDIIEKYISINKPVVISVNSILYGYNVDYLFYSNILRYEYSKENYSDIFERKPKILTSNVKTIASNNENIVNYNSFIKRGWKYFDNSTIMCLRMLAKLKVKDIAIAGFDGYNTCDEKCDDYVDKDILTNLSIEDKKLLNSELKEMLDDFVKSNDINIKFITNSYINKEEQYAASSL